MKIKKICIIVSIAIIIVFLGIVFIIYEPNIQSRSAYYEVFWNVSLGIIGSTVVTLFISIGDYLTTRNIVVKSYMKQVRRILEQIAKVSYEGLEVEDKWLSKYCTQIKTYQKTHNEAVDIANQHYSIHEMTDQEQRDFISFWLPVLVDRMRRVVESYKRINEISFNDLIDSYEEIEFMFFNQRERRWINEKIQKPLENAVKSITVWIQHIDVFLAPNRLDLDAVVTTIEWINELFFRVETEIKGEGMMTSVYFRFIEEIEEVLREFDLKVFKHKYEKVNLNPIMTGYKGPLGKRES